MEFLLSPVLRGLRGAGLKGWVAQAAQQYVTTLDNAGGMYYDVTEPVNPQGDFEFECTFFRGSQQSQGQFIYCEQESVSKGYGLNIYITGDFPNGNGSASMFGTNQGSLGVTGLSEFKVYTLAYKKVGTTVTAYLNGVQQNVFTDVVIRTDVDVVSIGKQAASTSFGLTGGILGLKIWDGGDRDTGQLVRDYRFDDNDGVLVDYSKPLIPIAALTRFNNATPSTATWVHNEDGSTTMTTSGSQSYAYNGWSFPAEEGKQYLCNISSDKAATLNIYAFTQGVVDYVGVANDIVGKVQHKALTSPIPVGKNRLLVVMQVGVSFGADTLTTQVPTVKQADGYGKAINVTPDDRELMTFDETFNAWVGGELINDGGFDNGMTSWLQTQSSVSVIGGRLINDGTNTVTNFVYQALPGSLLNQKVLVGINLYDYQDLGNFAISLSDGGATNPLDETVEHHSFLGTITKNTRVYLNFSSSLVMSVDNFSVKRAIEVSQ